MLDNIIIKNAIVCKDDFVRIVDKDNNLIRTRVTIIYEDSFTIENGQTIKCEDIKAICLLGNYDDEYFKIHSIIKDIFQCEDISIVLDKFDEWEDSYLKLSILEERGKVLQEYKERIGSSGWKDY